MVWGEKVYVPAIMGASGISKEQAKTCLYYAIATYLIPEKLDCMPILAIIGPQGTGKSCLLAQLHELVKEPIRIETKSIPTLRDKLAVANTALIDEGDYINEDYLIKRYNKETSQISYKKADKGSGWRTVDTDIFGATIIVRRTPFKDSATTSRSIIIRTRFRDGEYKILNFIKAKPQMKKISGEVSLGEHQATSNRVRDVWEPLRAIAECLGDTEWLKYSDKEIERSIKSLRGSQNYEPELALLLTLKERMPAISDDTGVSIINNVSLSIIKADLKSEFDLRLKNIQIQEMCRALGFQVVSHSGYPKVKCNRKLLDELLKDREL